MSGEVALQDGEARARIVAERARNVCVVAGAGTGKTTTIIARLVGMLAPPRDQDAPLLISRLAAITFTRRAAGELRFRLREALLAELGAPALSATRQERLREALVGLDTAFVGTIHAFADRLLRRRPTEAKLSPSTALIEDSQPLVAETVRRLLRAIERGELREALGAWGNGLPESRLEEAAQTVMAAQRAGIALERRRGAWGELPSLEALLQRLIDTRDVTPIDPSPPASHLGELRIVSDELRRAIERLPEGYEDEPGQRWLRQVASRLGSLEDDPAHAVELVQELSARRLKKGHFRDEQMAYGLYGRLQWEGKDWSRRIVGPHRWLGARLVRLAPVVVALYERVRAEAQVMDFVEVLLRLRDLLRDRPDVRGELQGLFDHIFVDEFQDTDPLQAEIIFYLCEEGAAATRWEEVKLAPGRLTVVGDPQQSIYRFRRADVVMYAAAVRHLQRDGALCERLSTNFRSRPELVEWFNRALPRLLGEGSPGKWLDPDGRARYQPLEPSPFLARFEPPQSVLVLHYAGPGQGRLFAGDGRAVEARAVARLLQNLLRPGSKTRVRDEDSGEPRALRPGDVAVLAESTAQLPLLVEALEAVGLEATTRGGRLMMDHPVVRALLLGYCALCDQEDGVSEGALLREPFFAIPEGHTPPRDDPEWSHAQEVVRKLRRLRLHRGAGALMRDLIEGTALTHALVRLRNGPQVLSACYEVAAELERRAVDQQLDAPGAAKIARAWAANPIPLVAPEPTAQEAIQILTIYQAKGLEFPVVVLWDGFRQLDVWKETDWLVARDGSSWSMRLGDVIFEHPDGAGLLQEERRQLSRERERLAYVAATRARDLLILPSPRLAKVRQERNRRLVDASGDVTAVHFEDGATPGWHRAPDPAPLPEPVGDPGLDMDQAARLLQSGALIEDAALGVDTIQPLDEAADEEARRALPESSWGTRPEEGQPGVDPVDEAVHHALALALEGASPAEAVDRVVTARALPKHRVEISEHLQRALAALERALDQTPQAPDDFTRARVPLLYPQEGARRLLKGSIDVLARRGDTLWAVELMTEKPPLTASQLPVTFPAALVSLRMIGEALDAAGVLQGARLRKALLFSRSGLWVEM
jgi:ATP-dependent exoDNAse (exonuclease V) beta subunit